jgi:hypothetical protein
VKKRLPYCSNLATLFASFSKAFVFGAFLLNQAAIQKHFVKTVISLKSIVTESVTLKKQMTKDEKKDKSNVPFFR